MNITSLYVKAQVDEMLARGANERLARSARTSVAGRNRLTDAVKGAWSLLGGHPDRPMTMPKLTDYPFRS